ncbi:hypothetical protein QLL95_gp0238 [Cotonvirus japonicus]|uniref:Ankyrin repeat protein n=1 Tax=Cotonvirus japonicus TaxID=2811091 RepID=A0ABM7NRL4_9VIRU|nr:hypothetical protein QLL95_gp0238 [Cotonvirus japonicus]BCS82727.1 hypothetical protein [Cotonvirus japonicus]
MQFLNINDLFTIQNFDGSLKCASRNYFRKFIKPIKSVNVEYILKNILNINVSNDCDCYYCLYIFYGDNGYLPSCHYIVKEFIDNIVENNEPIKKPNHEEPIINNLVSKCFEVCTNHQINGSLVRDIIKNLNYQFISNHMSCIIRRCMFEFIIVLFSYAYYNGHSSNPKIYGPMILDILTGKSKFDKKIKIELKNYGYNENIVLLHDFFDVKFKDKDNLIISPNINNLVFMEYFLSKKYVQNFLKYFDVGNWIDILNVMHSSYLNIKFCVAKTRAYYLDIDYFFIDFNDSFVFHDENAHTICESLDKFIETPLEFILTGENNNYFKLSNFSLETNVFKHLTKKHFTIKSQTHCDEHSLISLIKENNEDSIKNKIQKLIQMGWTYEIEYIY